MCSGIIFLYLKTAELLHFGQGKLWAVPQKEQIGRPRFREEIGSAATITFIINSEAE